jgi:hypothetical protein
MSAILERSCRVHYCPCGAAPSLERTHRLERLSATGCTIVTDQTPASDLLELRIDVPDSEEPVRVEKAKVMWGNWDGFVVQFLDMAAAEQRRLREYLWTMSLLEET